MVISFFNLFLLQGQKSVLFSQRFEKRWAEAETGNPGIKRIFGQKSAMLLKTFYFGSESVVTADRQQKFENRWQNWKTGGAGIGNR